MTETPPAITSIKCESCAGETTPADTPTWVVDSTSDEITRHALECTECGHTGWVGVIDGEITEFGGDIFPEPEHSSYHHGWRQEPNVLYKEHYRLKPNNESPLNSPVEALDFTNDEILAGWDPTVTYECSCHLSFESKRELAEHLLAVQQNRSENVQ